MHSTTSETIDLLEQRLARLQFLLHGDTPDDSSPSITDAETTVSITSRLRSLEKSLNAITAQSRSAADLLRLHKQFPDVWDEESASSDSESMPDSALAALVLSYAPSYHANAARLNDLKELPVPDASSAASLTAAEPRILRAVETQQRQQDEIEELRERSLAVIGRWYQLGIVGMGECWDEYESRLMETEKAVRKAEAQKRSENEAI